ncbi:MAG: 2,3-diphosphoglycerate-dependent phosphoglycerate mutase [bacterium]
MYQLVLVRHGESVWNKENRFTGWTDVDLSDLGVEEAETAGKTLKEKRFYFDEAHCSVLKRAIRTLQIILDEMDIKNLPIYENWRLNERHYGSLQGLNKAEMIRKYGEKQVQIWRRSFSVRPPALEKNDPRNPALDPKYKDMEKSQIPLCESLEDTINRMMPYWHQVIAPNIKKGRKIIISAHGNSLRALIKHLDNISDSEIPKLEIPTGKPLIYELGDQLEVFNHYYLEG